MISPRVVFYQVGTQYCGLSTIFQFQILDPYTQTGQFCVFADLDNTHARASTGPVAQLLKSKCDFIVSNGDIAYNLYQEQGKVADDFFNLMQRLGTQTPMVFIVGDHEYSKRPSEALSFGYNIFTEYTQAANAYFDHRLEHFFSWNANGFHYTVLNTDRFLTRFNFTKTKYPPNDFKGQFPAWLSDDLTAVNKTSTPRTIVFGHRSIYCHKSGDRECNYGAFWSETKQLQRKIERHLVQHKTLVVFSGHTHHYERSWPVYQQDIEPQATLQLYQQPSFPTYVVCGSAGQDCDRFSIDPPKFNAVRDDGCTYSFSKVSYDASSVNVSQIRNIDGNILDFFTIET